MPDSTDQSTCPVDHKSREAWLAQARAASESQPSLPPYHPPVPTQQDAVAVCPVDHKAREAWLQHAGAAAQAPGSSCPVPHSQPQPSSWTSSLTSWLSLWSSSSGPSAGAPASLPPHRSRLATDREISSIPRTAITGPTSCPANTEVETGADIGTGNWIYPSEKMFFEAMKRKGHDPQAMDMQTVVPIHNAVNERAWKEIKEWEGPWIKGSSCDGPRLHSFSGLSTKMSPKARFKTLLGYSAPFDRHDWVVDRCGKEIDYVIDFYAGRNNGDGRPSFYLDVRPKLNSWEGVKMRVSRGMGII